MARHAGNKRAQESERSKVNPWLVGGAVLPMLVAGWVLWPGESKEPAKKQTTSANLPQSCAGTHGELVAVVPTLLRASVEELARKECYNLTIREADGRAGVEAARAEDVDLWITDSSLWSYARPGSEGTATSLATSPVVATALPAVARTVTRNGRLSPTLVSTPGRKSFVAAQDPTKSAVGLLSAWSLLDARRRQADTLAYEPLALTAAAVNNVISVPPSWVNQPGENQLIYAAEYAVEPRPGVRILRAPKEPALDFPGYVLTEDPERSETAKTFVEMLASEKFADARAKLRLRQPDGLARFDATELGRRGKPMTLPKRRTVMGLFGLANSGSARGRSLVAVDVSGSMSEPSGNGGTTFDLVRNTALLAMSTLLDHTAIGVWEFGTDIDGKKDRKEVVPIRPLKVNRDVITKKMQTVGPVSGSGTSLYDTVLAGYSEVLDSYDPGAVHSLVVMTDGKNDNPDGIKKPELLRRLKELKDPERPVLFIGLGLGRADMGALHEIADITGGRALHISNPTQFLGSLVSVVGELAVVSDANAVDSASAPGVPGSKASARSVVATTQDRRRQPRGGRA